VIDRLTRWADGLVDAATDDDRISEVDLLRVELAYRIYGLTRLLRRLTG